jgi:thioesterase domain-containing protein
MQYPGYVVSYVPYPGTKSGQVQNSLDIINQYPGYNVVILGFSAGGDTATVVAQSLQDSGLFIEGVILLDPPFSANSLNMPDNSDFNRLIQRLTSSDTENDNKVSVFIADAFGGEDTSPLAVTQTDTDSYNFEPYPNTSHYEIIESPLVREDVFTFFGWGR